MIIESDLTMYCGGGNCAIGIISLLLCLPELENGIYGWFFDLYSISFYFLIGNEKNLFIKNSQPKYIGTVLWGQNTRTKITMIN